MQTRLDVPYRDKDEVKGLGARFNMSEKYWFVPDGVDIAKFRRWLPKNLQGWLKNDRNRSKNGRSRR